MITPTSLLEITSSSSLRLLKANGRVVPINSLDNQQIGAGGRGPITEQLQSSYFDQVRGIREANQNWHTLVE